MFKCFDVTLMVWKLSEIHWHHGATLQRQAGSNQKEAEESIKEISLLTTV